jgi:hypothetical protein
MIDPKKNKFMMDAMDNLQQNRFFRAGGIKIPGYIPQQEKESVSRNKPQKKKRTYLSEVSDTGGYVINKYKEEIDTEPLPDRRVGEIETHKHGTTASHYVNELWLTVHKYTQRMGASTEVVDVDGNVTKIRPNEIPNKMGGMASINCAASGTDFCLENRRKALILNKKINDEKNNLAKLERLIERKSKSKNVDMDEVIRLRLEFERISRFLSQARYHICGFCYANKAETGSPKAGKITPKYKQQSEYVRSWVIPREKLPQFNRGEVIRLDAHGDLEVGERGVRQFINYLNIIQHNPHTFFTLWTKNHKTVNETYRVLGKVLKPKNLTIIYSNPWVDKPIYAPPSAASWADGVFNVVYLDNYMKTSDGYVNVNGKRIYVVKCKKLCRECRVCYSGLKNFAVVELEKQVGSKNPHAYDHQRAMKPKTTQKTKKNKRVMNYDKVRSNIAMPPRFVG